MSVLFVRDDLRLNWSSTRLWLWGLRMLSLWGLASAWLVDLCILPGRRLIVLRGVHGCLKHKTRNIFAC